VDSSSAPRPDARRTARPWVVAFALLWLAFTGVFAYVAGGAYAKQWRASVAYVPTPGVVVRSDVKTVRWRKHDDYRPVIAYRYTVSGAELESRRYAFATYHVYQDADEAGRVVRRYPPGTDVTVYYDPARPANAVLNASRPRVSRRLVLVVAMLGSGVILLVFGVRGWGRKAARGAGSR
jgi:uncharacterized protein DUF3592